MFAATLFLLTVPVALAQLATGDNPADVADRAVSSWLDQHTLSLDALLSLPPDAA
jgi:hypothetical protein